MNFIAHPRTAASACPLPDNPNASACAGDVQRLLAQDYAGRTRNVACGNHLWSVWHQRPSDPEGPLGILKGGAAAPTLFQALVAPDATPE